MERVKNRISKGDTPLIKTWDQEHRRQAQEDLNMIFTETYGVSYTYCTFIKKNSDFYSIKNKDFTHRLHSYYFDGIKDRLSLHHTVEDQG